MSVSPPSGDITVRLIVNMQTSPTETIRRLGLAWATRVPFTHLLLAAIGLASLSLDDERDVLLLMWFGGGFSYVVVFLSGAVFHDHYAALMLPPLAVLSALGLRALSTELSFRLGSITRTQVAATICILLILGMSVGVATLTTTVHPETNYITEKDETGGYTVRQGSVPVVLTMAPDQRSRSFPQDAEAVAQFVNKQGYSHVGLIQPEAVPIYYHLSGNLSRVEIYWSSPGEMGRNKTLSRELHNDPSPADIVVAAKQNNWNGTLAGYKQLRESERFYVLLRTDLSTETAQDRDTRSYSCVERVDRPE